MHLARNNLRPGRILLGHDGARVAIATTPAPQPNKPPWHARVDWNKYRIAPSHSPDAAVVHLETAEDGKRYLCSIVTRDYTEAFVKKTIASGKQNLQHRPRRTCKDLASAGPA